MPGVSSAELLDLWERAGRLSPVERAVALASAGEAPAEAGRVAAMPLGGRDALLLRLRMDLAGPSLPATTGCPECGELLEFTLDAGDLLSGRGDGSRSGRIEAEGFVVEWRCPDSLDMRAAAGVAEAAEAERALLRRCITSAVGPDGRVPGDELPEGVRTAVAEAMESADPLAEVIVGVSCAACGTAFTADIDVSGFVWEEVEGQARRILREVDALARAYGWTEREVLALSDDRRAAYLRLAREGGP